MSAELIKLLLTAGLAIGLFGLLATMHVWMVPKSALPKRHIPGDDSSKASEEIGSESEEREEHI